MNDELAGGFLQDLIIGRVKKIVLEKLAEIQAAFLTGDVAAMEALLKWIGEQTGFTGDVAQIIELVKAIQGRDPATILDEIGDTFKLAATHFRKEAVRTMGAAPTVADELGASIEDVAAIDSANVSLVPDAEPKPEFFMEAIAVIGLVINIARWIRERRNN